MRKLYKGELICILLNLLRAEFVLHLSSLSPTSWFSTEFPRGGHGKRRRNVSYPPCGGIMIRRDLLPVRLLYELCVGSAHYGGCTHYVNVAYDMLIVILL